MQIPFSAFMGGHKSSAKQPMLRIRNLILCKEHTLLQFSDGKQKDPNKKRTTPFNLIEIVDVSFQIASSPIRILCYTLTSRYEPRLTAKTTGFYLLPFLLSFLLLLNPALAYLYSVLIESGKPPLHLVRTSPVLISFPPGAFAERFTICTPARDTNHDRLTKVTSSEEMSTGIPQTQTILSITML